MSNVVSVQNGSSAVIWPSEGLTRVPYEVYSDRSIYEREQAAIFRGRTWSFLCLEAEIPYPGDYKTTRLGDAPVIVARAADGAIHAFENRCAHRGALLCFNSCGNARSFTCVYHSWSYDLKGNLTGVAFRNGVDGKGGMPADFKLRDHGPRKLKVATFSGLVFGSYSPDTPPLEEYLGAEIAARIRRVLNRPIKVLGYSSQILPNNWKLYAENVKDSYHASLLHLFFTTFRINRLSQPGGVIVSESGANHATYSKMRDDHKPTEYETGNIRSNREGYRLADPSMLMGRDEFGDGITLQILTVFPSFVLQQIQNSLVVRQILPNSTDETELNWTYFGFADDTEEMTLLRQKQANLVGPGGYVSMEDGVVGGLIQRAIAAAGGDASVVEMGGSDAVSQDTRATETAVRGFWKAYRDHMVL
jgi:phenylpropionate dioxygenase-like ring-hydroxylating dioxygenase large terminal subunit